MTCDQYEYPEDDIDFDKDPEPTEPHASDCGIWTHEPCDCITGRL